MDGVLSLVSNRPGERVMGGALIAMITGTQASNITAYMREPLSALPKPGDTVHVRRRTFQRQTAISTVRDVGTQLEAISPALAIPITGGSPVVLGFPFGIPVPAELDLVAGEIVDIIHEPTR